jgi:serine/threonine-protein phosphatase 6 regulatory ankyrin repeat subunit B
MRAAEKGDAARVRALVRGGADVNASLSSGATALTLAARQGHLSVVKLLLAAGADPRVRLFSFHGGDYTALMAPIGIESEQRVEILDALIEAGGEINPVGGFGRSPLMYAVERRDLLSLGRLIFRGANVNLKNSSGFTTLMVAVASRSTPDVLRFLIDAGADVNARSDDGMTALSIAEQQNLEDTIRLLKEAGAQR